MLVAGWVRLLAVGAGCACAVSAVTATDALVIATGAAPVHIAASDATPMPPFIVSRRVTSRTGIDVLFTSRSSSVHFHDVIRLPCLVEELDAGTVEAKRHQEIPPADSLDKIRFWGVGWFRWAKPQINRTIVVSRHLVEAIDGGHQ